MIICGSCGHATPGDGEFCEGCGKSFNGRICPSKHRNSSSAEFCTVCGSDELSTATPATPIRMPKFLGRFVSAILALKVAVVCSSLLLAGLALTGNGLTEFVFGTSLSNVFSWLFAHFLIWCSVWFFLRLVFGRDSKVLKGYTDLSQKALQLSLKALVWLFKAGWRWLTQTAKKPIREEGR